MQIQKIIAAWLSKHNTHIYKLAKSIYLSHLYILAFKKFLDLYFFQKTKKKIVVSLIEHIGDIVASEPIDRYLKHQYKDHLLIRVVSIQYAELLRFNPNIDKIITVSCLSEWIYLKKILSVFYLVFDLHFDRRLCTKYWIMLSNPTKHGVTFTNYYHMGTLLDVFCLMANIPKLKDRPVYYLPPYASEQDYRLPECYVVIHTSSNAVERNWTTPQWEQIIHYLIEQKKLSVVEVGMASSISLKRPEFISLCGSLSLSEIAQVIKKSRFMIGVDSAFAHFANALSIPKIVLLGIWENFAFYTPYSGMTQQEENCIIHYHGKVRDIPVDIVIEKINLLLSYNK